MGDSERDKKKREEKEVSGGDSVRKNEKGVLSCCRLGLKVRSGNVDGLLRYPA